MFLLKCIVILISMAINFTNGYQILAFFPYPGRSNTILGAGYVRHLIKAGHNVTYVTPIPIESTALNLRQIDISSTIENFALQKQLDFKKMLSKEINFLDMADNFAYMHDMAKNALKHENVQKLLLDENEEFDVVIVQWLFTELFAGVAAVFNCPFIWASSMDPHPMVLRLIDDVPNPAYVPNCVSTYSPPFTFIERVKQLWHYYTTFIKKWTVSGEEKEVFEEALGPAIIKRGRQIPSFDEVRFNGSLMLGNSHVSTGLVLNLPQNYKPIAGFHINEEIAPLPENLKNILDNAENGVIYFSFGSLVKSKTMPEQMKRDFLEMFSELKQTVIWKLEQKLPNLPKNVHLVEWAPQQSILAHPNILLFITHGGMLSSTEALKFGVPIIGIPLMGDQFLNIKRAVAKGLGLYVPLSPKTPVNLKEAIKEIITEPKYREKVKELSFVFHDRPVSPGKELVHWVEHVVKTRGARYLRSVSSMVPWYQKLYLDLLATILLCVSVLIYTVRRFREFFKPQRMFKNKCD